MKTKMNWKPDLPDHRDFTYKASKKLPLASVDLRKFDTVIENQGNLGSCTGHAITSLIELATNLKEVKSLNIAAKMRVDNIFNKINPTQLSRLFVYYQERLIEGTVSSDSGASIRDGIKSCYSVGVCEEVLWPYKVNKFKTKPSSEAYADAGKRKIIKYLRINNLNEMLSALSNNKPVVFGFSVYESFESDKVAKTGIMPYPKKSEKMLGGHAVLAVGYDIKKAKILVKNSWGKNWGDGGYFWMPFKVVENRNMSDDFWTVEI